MSKKIDISSTAFEKSIDLAKGFLDKLISPAIEEAGLLMRDSVAHWRFKNQVRIVNKAKEICEKNNIDIKSVSPKLLCPLLDGASLEEDEDLQRKWAVLLANMVDSSKNLQSHVFPYILSQLSIQEFECLEGTYRNGCLRREDLNQKLAEFKKKRPDIESQLTEKLQVIEKELEEKYSNKDTDYKVRWSKQEEKRKIEHEIWKLPYQEGSLVQMIAQPQDVEVANLKEFEVSNILRLGLVKVEQEHYASTPSIEIPNESRSYEEYTSVEVNVDIESDSKIVLTELGELFVSACTELSSV